MQPLRASSWAEVHLYLKVTPCPACQRGPWEAAPAPPAAPASGDSPARILATCRHCQSRQEFVFRCLAEADQAGQAVLSGGMEWINLTSRPSELIDVGQWLGLFYHLVASADRAGDHAETRRLTFQAAQCLDEALKFYGPDDELPPPVGFLTAASRQAYAEHPEKFARQRLRDLRAKLPDLRRMAGRLVRDLRNQDTRPGQGEPAAPRPARRWWQLWKRQAGQ